VARARGLGDGRASEELRAFWQAHPRLTVTEYAAQKSAGLRAARDLADLEAMEAAMDEAEDIEAEAPGLGDDETGERPRMRHLATYADITAVEPEWLWDGRIPMGEVTLVVAKGGTGKTFAVTDLAARVTRGAAMPGGCAAGPAGSVVLISGDDDPGAVLAWRLMAAHADLARVIDCSEVDGAPFAIGGKDTMLPALHELVAAHGDIRAVILDPLARLTRVAITATKTINTEVMNPLRRMARETGCAVILVHHETKSGSIAGGQALIDSARSVLRVSKGDDGIRSVTVEKANMARDQADPVRYRLTGSSWADTHVEWLESGAPVVDSAPAQNAVLEALAKSATGLTAQQLAARTGISYGTVRVLLTKLKTRGLVASHQRGVWLLNYDNVRVLRPDPSGYGMQEVAR
jgi:hypothetical protein